ncbi:hypothetical protein H310_06530 [Aphanomyces invadans]|uniref:Arf-GAP domain-containing protein n=1 Tax=Aphanomyces invadans TaxID=157072 RepID=A0A024U800_9STRA|nr:hypothetical protein H310_06530 [Aphanomyces invadans]ETW02012.1 hypothetical protein H310_06530 [Aphanomyces invadans]|eukprot:XP_008869860.1 hypothetical protein H310_06530 [Aphanomyces invadans]
MASSAVDQKKVDEKHIKAIREFQKGSSANRRCFDCNEMGPQYICLDFNTFICTMCSGIHREFSHRIKSISMSTFTDTEVNNIIKVGGNEAAHKYWLARFDVNSQPSSNLNSRDRIRNFIRDVYIDRRWVFEEPKPRPEPIKQEVKKQPVPKPAAPVDFNPFQIAPPPSSSTPQASVAFGDFSSFDKHQQSTAAVDFADFASFDQQPTGQADFVADFDSHNSSTSEATVNFFQSPKAATVGTHQHPTAFQPFGEPVTSTKPVDSIFGSFDTSPAFHPPVATRSHDPFEDFPTSPAPVLRQQAPSTSTNKAMVMSDPFGDFDAVVPTSKTDPFSNAFATPASTLSSSQFTTKASAHDPFASIDAPVQKPAATTASVDPFNAFDTLVAPDPPTATYQTPSFNTAAAVDLWGQPPPPSKPQSGSSAFGSTPSTTYAPQATQHKPHPPVEQTGYFPTKATPFDAMYSSNQASNPAFPSNPAAYSSHSFVNKDTAPQKSLVDPFASLDIGIKSSTAASTPYHVLPTHQFQSHGFPANQPHYASNNQSNSYHPNIVVAPVSQKPTSTNPFDMF